jgi:enamine deaminase RidA (YjgF/YER057c/UK114 family)
MAIMAVPGSRGSFQEQAQELLAQVRCIINRQRPALVPTTMMVFLREAGHEAACREIVGATFGSAAPVTTYVVQAPCCGAELGLELWALGGPEVKVERYGRRVLAVECDGIRWVYAADIRGGAGTDGPYAESLRALRRMQAGLEEAGVGLIHLVRTWIYVNRITSGPEGAQRYQELNRARTDFFRGIRFGAETLAGGDAGPVFPASTGIGTQGTHISMAGLAMSSARPDVFIVPLESPKQTSAYSYSAAYSPQSPKFSRAMALVQGHYLTLLVSGTASIMAEKTVHAGDIVGQTRQTLDNIECLVSAENLARHGLPGAGVTFGDVAKLRVYVKHLADYEACRSVVESRLPGVPCIYLHAEVCRPDLLVEIEAVAFTPLRAPLPRRGGILPNPGRP